MMPAANASAETPQEHSLWLAATPNALNVPEFIFLRRPRPRTSYSLQQTFAAKPMFPPPTIPSTTQGGGYSRSHCNTLDSVLACQVMRGSSAHR